MLSFLVTDANPTFLQEFSNAKEGLELAAQVQVSSLV